ncbi:Uncharacterised protein [Vibrio cholerae]|nr:Uncharacterised protein [Vibrio cholerae]
MLNPFTRHVTCDGWVFRLTRNFVNFIDIDDTTLRFCNIVIAFLQQLLNDIFYIFAHITRFG